VEAAMSNYSPARSPDQMSAPAGWYPDPFGRHQYRYWDGVTWSSSVSDGGVQSQDTPGQRGGPAVSRRDQDQNRAAGSDGRSRRAGRFVGFLTSLPALLTGVAGMITAAGTIWISTQDKEPAPPLVVAAEDLGVDQVIEENSESEPSPAYSEYMSVTDDTGTIVVDVPVEWTDVNGAPWVLDDGTAIPDVAASSDSGAFLGTYDAPGVEVSATDISVVDVPTAMALLAPTDCTSAGSDAYDDSVFAGEVEFFTDCAGTDTIYLLLAAEYTPDPERIAIVRAQILSDSDVDAVGRALETFDFRS
jgi:hypothetical protein